MQKLVDEVNQMPGSPAAASPASEVMESVHAIMHLYRSRHQRSLRTDEHELAHMEIKVLGFFARNPNASQSELVAYSGRDKAQVARLIRGLRERGLLDARADELDRRSRRLSLTGQGGRTGTGTGASGLSSQCQGPHVVCEHSAPRRIYFRSRLYSRPVGWVSLGLAVTKASIPDLACDARQGHRRPALAVVFIDELDQQTHEQVLLLHAQGRQQPVAQALRGWLQGGEQTCTFGRDGQGALAPVVRHDLAFE
jgi:DNA-binding MarR family transcriptional regulator